MIDKEIEEYIINHYSTDTIDDISKVTGLNKNKIKYYANKNNIYKFRRFSIDKRKEEYIRNNYLIKTYKEISEYVGMSEKQLRGWIYNHIDDRKLKIRKFNNRYFDTINTPTKAYWLGFIFADGWIVKNEKNRNYEFGIELKRSDEYMLEELNNCLGGVHKIKRLHNEMFIANNSNISKVDISVLRIYSKDIVEDLYKNGIDFRKTYSGIFPIVSDHLFIDFLRGYIDGDGCIYIMNHNTKFLCVNITCCKPFVLEYINKKLYDMYGIETSIYKETENKYRIFWFAQDKVKKILDLIYGDFDTPFLIRKNEIYKNFYGLAS